MFKVGLILIQLIVFGRILNNTMVGGYIIHLRTNPIFLYLETNLSTHPWHHVHIPTLWPQGHDTCHVSLSLLAVTIQCQFPAWVPQT
jgi:hypothetical protein